MASHTLTAPKTRSQPSRKGKRTWRKNIDLDDVEAGLDDARDEIIQTGGARLADVPADLLFQTDVVGDKTVGKGLTKRPSKTLKADEILGARSAVPAVAAKKRSFAVSQLTNGLLPEKRRKRSTVSGTELARLRQLAYGGQAVHKDVVAVDANLPQDLWSGTSRSIPLSNTATFAETEMAVRQPRTLFHAPVSLLHTGRAVPHVRKPTAAGSYNPAFEDWEASIVKEGVKAVAAETKLLAEEQMEAERQERIAATAAEAERLERDLAESGLSEYESEWSGIQSDVEQAQLKAKRPQRKTPAERNKVKKRKVNERLAKHDSKMRMKEDQLKQIHLLRKDVLEGSKRHAQGLPFEGSVKSDSDLDENNDLRRRKFGKIALPEAPLELVLADELQDSLRRLKPEGNLLRDRFRNIQVQGKVEARRAITQPKKANRKATEKWSYKDWRLPRRST